MHSNLKDAYPIAPICNSLFELSVHGNDSNILTLIGANDAQSIWKHMMDLLSALYENIATRIRNVSWKSIVDYGPVPHMLEDLYSLLHKSLQVTGSYFYSAMKKVLQLSRNIWDYIASVFMLDTENAREETSNFETLFNNAITYFVSIGKHIAKGLLYIVTNIKHAIWYATQMLSSYFIMSIETAYEIGSAMFSRNVVQTTCTMACGMMDIMQMTEKQTFVEEKVKLLFTYFQRTVEEYTPLLAELSTNPTFLSSLKTHWLYNDLAPAFSWILKGLSWLVKTFRVVYSSVHAWLTCIFQAMFTLFTNIASVHIESYINSEECTRIVNQNKIFQERCKMLKDIMPNMDETSQTSARETLDVIDTIQSTLVDNVDKHYAQRDNLNMDTTVGEWSERANLMTQLHFGNPVDKHVLMRILERQYGYTRLKDSVYLAAGMNKLVADGLLAAVDEMSEKYDDQIREMTNSVHESFERLTKSPFTRSRPVNGGVNDDDEKGKNIDELNVLLNDTRDKGEVLLQKLRLKKQEAEMDVERMRPDIEARFAKASAESDDIHEIKYNSLVTDIVQAESRSKSLQIDFNRSGADHLLVAKEQMKTTTLVTFYSDFQLRDALYAPAMQKVFDIDEKISLLEDEINAKLRSIERKISTRESSVLKKTIVGSVVFVGLLGAAVYYATPHIIEPIKNALTWYFESHPKPQTYMDWASDAKDRIWNFFTGTVVVKDLKFQGMMSAFLGGDTVGIAFLIYVGMNSRRIFLFFTRLIFEGLKGMVALFQGESIKYAFKDLTTVSSQAAALEQGLIRDTFTMAGMFKQKRAEAITNSVNAVAGIVSAVNPIAGVTARGIANVVERSVNQPTALNYDNYYANPNVDPQLAYGSTAVMEQRKQQIHDKQQTIRTELDQKQRNLENSIVVAQQARNDVQQHGSASRNALLDIISRQESKKPEYVAPGALVVIEPAKEIHPFTLKQLQIVKKRTYKRIE